MSEKWIEKGTRSLEIRQCLPSTWSPTYEVRSKSGKMCEFRGRRAGYRTYVRASLYFCAQLNICELMKKTTAVVLAAGKGTRMKSDLPKVLFPVLGRPMIHWVLDALQQAGVDRTIVVVGYRDDLVRQQIGQRIGVEFALQSEQLGTGHAVQMCRDALKRGDEGPVLIVAGDSPLIQASSVVKVLSEFSDGRWDCLLGTLLKSNPFGLGRIVRDASGHFEKIVEQKDATDSEKEIREVNMSTYVFGRDALLWALDHLGNSNAQKEYYLTDCPALLRKNGKRVEAKPLLQDCEALSINTIDELSLVESKMKEMGYPCAN